MILEILVLLAIAVFAFLDIKHHAVPSFMTTTIILALLLILPQHLIWGISAFVFGWLLSEFDFLGGKFFGGLADVKVMTIIGLMLSNLTEFAVMMILTAGLAVLYSIGMHYEYKGKIPKEVPFIPVLLLVYVAVLIARSFI